MDERRGRVRVGDGGSRRAGHRARADHRRRACGDVAGRPAAQRRRRAGTGSGARDAAYPRRRRQRPTSTSSREVETVADRRGARADVDRPRGGGPIGAVGAQRRRPSRAWLPTSCTPSRAHAVVPDMPHWTDPPTGQVPAVLDRRSDDDGTEAQWSAAGDTGPAWREHSHEWDDSTFDPSLLADDDDPGGRARGDPAGGAPAVGVRRPGHRRRRPTSTDRDGRARRRPASGERPDEPRTTTTCAGHEPEADRTEADDRRSAPEPGAPRAGPAPNGGGLDQLVAPAGLGRSARRPAAIPGARRRVAGRRRPGQRTSGSRSQPPVAIATGVGFVARGRGLLRARHAWPPLALATVVVVLAAAECYAALRRSGSRPATLLGLVATGAVMVAAYAKGARRPAPRPGPR